VLFRSEVHALEPRLTTQIIGAAYEDESAQLDSYRLTLALAQASEKRGAELQLRPVTGLLIDKSRVTGVRTATGDIECGTVVMAAGTWSASFGEALNFPIPVRPLKGERLILRFDGPPLPVLISSPKRGHMISRLDGVLSVGSTGGRDYDQKDLFWGEEYDVVPTETAKLELLQRAIDVFPELESAELVQQLAGSRPLSPDRMPIIGPVPGMDGIVLATGHSTKGIHLGPITGRVVAEYIQSGCVRMPEETQAFHPDRFSTASEIDFHASGQLVDE
jgi:glycine/D-amino acid oxidase-like deaminating enzyme